MDKCRKLDKWGNGEIEKMGKLEKLEKWGNREN